MMKILIEAIRFKVEQRMEGARKDRNATQKTGFPRQCFVMDHLKDTEKVGA